jgi:hypothetical protein
MFTNLGPFLDNFRTKWTFPGEEPFVNFFDGFIHFCLQRFMPEF